MRKVFFIFFVIFFIVCIAVATVIKFNFKAGDGTVESIAEEPKGDINSVEYSGWLKTDGSALKNQHGEDIQLRGLSSHGIAWYSDVVTHENLRKLKEEWNTNVFRIAMYTDPNSYGYIANPEKNMEIVCNVVDMAVSLDMYVIIDWHILGDSNPKTYESQAREFFDTVSKKYMHTPNVIYEICNEPNGSKVTWENDVKPYAQDIINTIRANSPKSLIIVGTPDWCKDLVSVTKSPLYFDNVVYACHFYAGSHGYDLKEQIDYAISKNIPIFVSECGMTNASGNGEIYADKFESWVDFLNERNISWLYWSFSNKDEGSSVLSTQYPVHTQQERNSTEKEEENNEVMENENSGGEEQEYNETLENADNDVPDINEYLTEAGKVLKDIFLSYDNGDKKS